MERDAALMGAGRQEASISLRSAIFDQEDGARGFLQSGDRQFLGRWRDGTEDYADSLAQLRSLVAADPVLERELADQAQLANLWRANTAEEIAQFERTGRPEPHDAIERDRTAIDAFRAANARFSTALSEANAQRLTRATTDAVVVVAALAALLVAAGLLLARRAARREAARQREQAALRELLQISESEHEARSFLIGHLQLMLPAAAAAVLSPDEQQARLEITAATPSDPAVARAGQRTLSPRSCMAIRLGRAHDRTPDDENLLRCDVCGATAGTSACEPLLVGGQTIGSVLVTAPKPLSPECRERFRETVAQAAPILANQRNLALARSLARSDALTGLANRRAADEMLERLSAQSARSRTPLAAVLMDLDNLKQINDRHGHAAGDRALALIGATIAASLRETDFAARIGGDEFVLLLPDTGRDGARTAAEKLRAAVAAVQAGDIGQISASLGVAIMPDDATDAESLLREADAALYAAKEQGRNCIAVYTPDDEFPRHSQRRPHVDSRPGEAPAWENALS